LIESQAPPAPQGDVSSSKAGSTSFSQTARAFQQLQSTKLANVTQRNASRALKAVGANKKDEKEVLAEASMSRHIEQRELMLRSY
jgi:alpha-ketoglutarate-dependent taurine dioxygenase